MPTIQAEDKFSWTCPYCSRPTTVNSSDHDKGEISFVFGKNGWKLIGAGIKCPNPECGKFTLTVDVREIEWNEKYRGWTHKLVDPKHKWQLIPLSGAKPFPDYIPKPILEDYSEACLIKDLSPKASATLARRCLQGMIRDFWGIRKKNLKPAIDKLKGKVDPKVWEAIDTVRHVGNIGAHMEKDINLIIDVEPDEATLLIGLIEMLLKEWYIARHERNKSLDEIVALKETKRPARGQTPSSKSGE